MQSLISCFSSFPDSFVSKFLRARDAGKIPGWIRYEEEMNVTEGKGTGERFLRHLTLSFLVEKTSLSLTNFPSS